MAHQAGELYVEMMNEMGRLISTTPIYLTLFKECVRLVGAEEPLFNILEEGEDGLASILDSMEKLYLTVGKEPGTDKLIQYPALLVLKNLTTKLNLACGFTTKEWMELVKYVVITEWRSYNGAIFADRTDVFDDDKPNNKQSDIIDFFFQHPFLLPLMLMEGCTVVTLTE